MIAEKLLEMASQGVRRVIFYGVSDEMEVAYVTLQGTNMELVAIVDHNDEVKGKSILGREAKDPGELDNVRADAILITSILDREKILKSLKKRKYEAKLFTIS